MPKYDAFGREIGKDTLSGLGGGSDATVEAAPSGAAATPESLAATPAPARQRPEPAQVPSFDAPAPAIPGVRRSRRSGLGCLVGLVILGAVVVGPVIALVGLAGEAGDAIDEITGVIDSADPGVTDEPQRPAKPAKPPVGLARASMVSKRRFARALARIRAAGMEKAVYIRLAPERLDAQVLKGSRVRNIQLRFDGGFDRGTPSPGGASGGTIAFSRIDTAAPERLVRAGAKRARLRPKRIDYLVAMSSPEGQRWLAYFKRGPFVEGDASGRLVRLTPR